MYGTVSKSGQYDTNNKIIRTGIPPERTAGLMPPKRDRTADFGWSSPPPAVPAGVVDLVDLVDLVVLPVGVARVAPRLPWLPGHWLMARPCLYTVTVLFSVNVPCR